MEHLEDESPPDVADQLVRPRQSRRSARRYVDTFLRHWPIALVPALVLPLVAVGVMRLTRPAPQVGMNLWVSQDSIKPLSYANPLDTPGQNLQAALQQLLQSRSFDLKVARESPLYWKTVTTAQYPDVAAVTDLSTKVKVVATGPDLVGVTYSNKQSLAAIQLLQNIAKETPQEIQRLNQQQATSAVALYTRQKKDANTRLARDAKKLGTYMKEHNIPSSQMAEQSLFDAEFAALYQAVQADQVDLSNAERQLSQNSQQAAAQSAVQVIDPPGVLPSSSGKKALVLDLGIGLIVGLLLGGLFVVWTTAADHSVRYEEEVPDLLGLPVLVSVPFSEGLARASQSSPAAPLGRKAGVGRAR